MDWNRLASSIIKMELARRNITYEQLLILLNKIGVKETIPSIRSKMSRGKFQFSFFLQCATAIGIKMIRFDEIIENQQS